VGEASMGRGRGVRGRSEAGHNCGMLRRGRGGRSGRPRPFDLIVVIRE
jgi:hypothetical protein